MKRATILAALPAFAILSAGQAGAQTAAARTAPSAQSAPALPAPPIGQPKTFSVPASETYRLPSGMQVTLVPYGSVPKTVVALQVYAGNLEEGRDTGLSDLAGEMLKEGAGNRTGAQLAQAAAAMGGNLTVGVTPIGTAIGMSSLSDFTPAAVALVADVARRPTFPAGEFERVKANRLRDLAQAYAQPGVIASYALARAYYGDHPYGRALPTPAQAGAYTLAQARGFHAANFGARRAHLYIAGRFDAAAVKAAVAQAFGDWQAGPERLSQVPTPAAGPKVVLVDRPGAAQSTIRLAWPAPVPGTAGDIPLRVSNALLGGSFSSRITRNIREDKGYTYSPGSGVSQLPGTARWTFNGDVTTAVTGASLKEIFGEVTKLQREAPGTEEATGMRTYNAGLFVLQNSNSQALVQQLASRDALGLPADWLDRYVPATLAVTDQQISDTIRTTLPAGKFTLVVVGDLKTVRPQLDALPELKGVPIETVTVP